MADFAEFRVLADVPCDTGEGPLYHPGEGAVYWTDIPAGRLYRLEIATGEHACVHEGSPIGGMTLQADGSLLLFRARGTVEIWRDGRTETVIAEIPDETETRFNDVIADPLGGVFCGTMPTRDRRGRLYRLAPTGELVQLLDGIGCSNGMGFSPDRTVMYYTDSGDRTITQFTFDPQTGKVSDRRPFVTVSGEGEGVPDGMTVDANGNIWSTRWDGNAIVGYRPDGTEFARFRLPIRKVSCLAFGGPHYATAYVTTAGGHLRPNDGEWAGSLLAMDLGVTGVPEFRSRIGLPATS
ncbi:MAG: SMP-30/gluconolactonase/LRE family protein [Fimbriimonadaceae bacterium]|nr:SMP-30/gluconolactonase/LRE family protein [Fimbriimonadaceae bacterium]